MYEGYMIIGTNDPIGNPGDFAEIINNPRAYAYAADAGLCWLHDCGACDTAAVVTPGYPFVSPIADPAPWYDQADPDSWGFLGVIGLDVVGDESSTRQAEVKMSLSGTGMIGPTYMGPRTLVVRALAIATDDCSLQYGLTWLRRQYGTSFDPCGGDVLTFFDCCPCVCEDEMRPSDCWATTYAELKGEPACATTFWPDTYAELITGPSTPTDEWCRWIERYREIDTGPPQWTCCVDACVVPYLRQFYNVRVTRGPVLLNRPTLHSNGAVAEIEFTVICGDPQVHAMVTRAGSARVSGSSVVTDTPASRPLASPYPTLRREESPVVVPTTWLRDVIPWRRPDEQVLTDFTPLVRVRARQQSGPVRLGLWAGEERVGGFTIPYVAPGTAVVVNGRSAHALIGGTYEALPSFVRGWDGRRPDTVELPHGIYTLTVDQHPDEAVELTIDAFTVPVGAG